MSEVEQSTPFLASPRLDKALRLSVRDGRRPLDRSECQEIEPEDQQTVVSVLGCE